MGACNKGVPKQELPGMKSLHFPAYCLMAPDTLPIAKIIKRDLHAVKLSLSLRSENSSLLTF